MELPDYIKDIREQLTNDEITWEAALTALKDATDKKKPWHKKEWKAARATLIKDACTQCGTSKDEAIMVLQHLWQPRNVGQMFYSLTRAYSFKNERQKQDYIEEQRENAVEINNIIIGDRDCCPKCDSTSIKLLKGTGQWKCYAGKGNKKCCFEFNVPATRKELTPSQKQEITDFKHGIWRDACNKFDVSIDDIKKLHGKRVVLDSIKDTERYYSLKDTTTFCKKCAYLMDVKELVFCSHCKDYYPLYHTNNCQDREESNSDLEPEALSKIYLDNIRRLLSERNTTKISS